MKAFTTILLLVVGTLVWALYALHSARHQRGAQQQSNEVVIFDFSNRWHTTRRSLDEQRLLNHSLRTNLAQRLQQLDALRRELADLHSDIARSRAESRTAQTEIARRDSLIQTLESRIAELTQTSTELQAAILELEERIADAERQLAAAAASRHSLLDDLESLRSEKAGLEKELHDVALLRDQVRDLRQELTIARRLEWIRRSLDTPGTGVGSLATNPAPPPEPHAHSPTPDVESARSGDVTVIAPTHSPAEPQ